MSHPFFAFISRMRYINRWGLMRNSRPENVAEHSAAVAMIAHALAVIRNRRFGGHVNADRVALLALYHDAEETITGDMPTPVKYFNPQIKASYGEIETQAKERLLSMLPEALSDDYRAILFGGTEEEQTLIKAADVLAAYIKCIEEENSGNRDFARAKEANLAKLQSMGLPEANVFLEEYVPAFSQSLDELGE